MLKTDFLKKAKTEMTIKKSCAERSKLWGYTWLIGLGSRNMEERRTGVSDRQGTGEGSSRVLGT